MWTVKKFKTKLGFDTWKAGPGRKCQWLEIFIDNVPYAVQYRQLVKPRMPR